MPETIALFRCAVARHRIVTLVMLGVIVFGEAITLIAAAVVPDLDDASVVIASLFFSLFSAAIAVLVLFDYGQEKDMMSLQSGCNDWILRMPIASWKIAIVPVILKTIWISGVWILFCLTATWLGIDGVVVPVLTPCICISGAVIWVLLIAWRPVRSGWSRLGMLAVIAPILYLALTGLFFSAQPENIRWYPLAIAASIAIYGSGVWLTIQSVQLARTSSLGIIPEAGKTAATVNERPDVRRNLRSHFSALLWHDLVRRRGVLRYTMILGVVPSVVVASLFIPLNGTTVVISLILFMYLGGIASLGSGMNALTDGKSTIPPYIAASPLSTVTIAWTRLLTIAATSLVVFSFVLFVFVGWSLWPENRAAWYQWASSQATALDSPDHAVSIGVRWSIAIVLSTMVFFVGRMMSFLWVDMIGRNWVQVVVAIAMGLAILAPISVVTHWMLAQTDWEGAIASAYSWLAVLPSVIIGLLIVKVIATISATVALSRRRLTSTQQIVTCYAIWFAATVLIASTLAALIPDPRATVLWCLAFTALAIPLARVLIMPVALSLNRHR